MFALLYHAVIQSIIVLYIASPYIHGRELSPLNASHKRRDVDSFGSIYIASHFG